MARSLTRDDGKGVRNQNPSDPDSDIKMLALSAVMRQNPSQGLVAMRTILTGSATPDLKKHALFILVQSKSPDSEALMHEIVLGKMGPDLQLQAIESSGIYRGKQTDASLTDVYRSATDVKVKRAVISALFIAQDDTHLVELARQEKDLELKRRIVSRLSLMKGKAAGDYMMELLK